MTSTVSGGGMRLYPGFETAADDRAFASVSVGLPGQHAGLADGAAVLRQPTLRDGRWSLLECVRVWQDNASSDNFIAFHWERNSGESLCVVVNYAAQQSQCFVGMPFQDLEGRSVRFRDHLGPDFYDRQRDDLLNRGLFVDMPAWGHNAFDVQWLA